MTVRLSQSEIAEAVREYLHKRGVVSSPAVTFTWRGAGAPGAPLDATVDIDQPPKDGPYR